MPIIQMNEAIPRPFQQPPMGAVVPQPASSSCSNGTTTTRTILRIKRRLTETPIPCIRLEGLNNGDPDELRGDEAGVPHNMAKRQRSSAVLWKRFDPSDGNPTSDMGNGGIHDNGNGNGGLHEDTERKGGEKYRIVDAMFLSAEGDSGEDDDDNNNLRSTKRRKLTLLDTSTIADEPPSDPKSPSSSSSPMRKKKRGKALKVLDPLTRIVDDSLQEVLIGEKTVESHYRQLTTDPRFTMREPAAQTRWMTWSLDGGTNLLHCCALWNDASIANELLQRFGGSGNYYHTGSSGSSSIRSALMEAQDGDDRTPYEVAQLIGHIRVCEVLEVYGGDTSNYVYDVFYLDQDGLVKTRPNDDGESKASGGGTGAVAGVGDGGSFDSEEGPGITTAELTSGIGYWTPEGELILETVDQGRRARSLSQETEADIDSNCEEYGGNDYPEDEDVFEDSDPYAGIGIAPGYNPFNSEYGHGAIDDDGGGGGDEGYADEGYVDEGYAEYDWD